MKKDTNPHAKFTGIPLPDDWMRHIHCDFSVLEKSCKEVIKQLKKAKMLPKGRERNDEQYHGLI